MKSDESKGRYYPDTTADARAVLGDRGVLGESLGYVWCTKRKCIDSDHSKGGYHYSVPVTESFLHIERKAWRALGDRPRQTQPKREVTVRFVDGADLPYSPWVGSKEWELAGTKRVAASKDTTSEDFLPAHTCPEEPEEKVGATRKWEPRPLALSAFTLKLMARTNAPSSEEGRRAHSLERLSYRRAWLRRTVERGGGRTRPTWEPVL